MVRTQVQLTETQMAGLRQLSHASGKSVAEIVRGAVDRVLREQGRVSRDEQVRRALEAVGRFSSGLADVSVRHDDYLAEAYKD